MQPASRDGQDRLTKRAFLTTLGSGAGMFLLAACGVAQAPAAPTAPIPKPTSPTTAAAPPATAVTTAVSAPPASAQATVPAAARPRAGGQLRTGLLTDLSNLDPHAGSTPSHESVFLAFDHLTAYDEKLSPQPRLAESWETSSDLKQIKLNLRRGVQFHTGRELTSEDVKWNILRVRDPKSSSASFANQSKWFTSMETPDKYTLVLGSDQPRPAAFDFFEFLNIADPVTMEGPEASTKAVGTGPFVFVEWAQGDHITMRRNTNYWQTGRPYVDSVVGRVIRDPQAQLIQLETNAIDVMKNPSLRDFSRLRADAKYTALVHPFSGTFYMQGANVQHPPFDNKKVRQALSFAIDRKRIVETVLLGFSQPQSLPWLSFSPAFEPEKEHYFSFDLDKARALLAEAGVSNLVTELIPIPTNPELVDMAQIYQADLAKIGVTLNIKPVEAATWFDMANNRTYQGFYSTLNGLAQMEPVTLLLGGRVYDPVSNNSGFKSQTYQDLLERAAAEPDRAARARLYSQINDVLLDECFAMPIAAGQPRMLTRAAVHDIGFNMWSGSFNYTHAWLDA